MEIENEYAYLTKEVKKKTKIDILKDYMFFGYEEVKSKTLSHEETFLEMRREKGLDQFKDLNQVQKEWETIQEDISKLKRKLFLVPALYSGITGFISISAFILSLLWLISYRQHTAVTFGFSIGLLSFSAVLLLLSYPIFRFVAKKKLKTTLPIIDAEKTREEELLKKADHLLKEYVDNEK